MVNRTHRLRPIVLVCVSLLLGTGASAAAGDASTWDGDARSAARLIAGSQPAAGAALLRAGIEIRLKPGWHTYWRYPGDSGVPPQFDFKASENVKAIDVLWPAPRRLPYQGGTSIGYDQNVILPLQVAPQVPGKPVVLRLRLDYAVCEKLCVPAEAKAELALPSGASSRDSALAAAEARVPKKTAVGEGRPLAVRLVQREAGAARSRILVDVAAPAGGGIDLFAEGPTAQWALPIPKPIDGATAGLQRFVFALDGAPPGAEYHGAVVTLTAVAGQDAIEVSTRLD